MGCESSRDEYDSTDATGAASPHLRRVERDWVVLVDECDRPIGTEAKLAAHQGGGRLHRAFSVFIVDPLGRLLLQRRARAKYHFGGLWTNACCSHPLPDEDVAVGARQRLRQEFGFDAKLTFAFSFVYRAEDPASGLTEHEFDHVFTGVFDGPVRPDPDEIDGHEWVEPTALLADVRRRPERYTPWFKIALDHAIHHLPPMPNLRG